MAAWTFSFIAARTGSAFPSLIMQIWSLLCVIICRYSGSWKWVLDRFNTRFPVVNYRVDLSSSVLTLLSSSSCFMQAAAHRPLAFSPGIEQMWFIFWGGKISNHRKSSLIASKGTSSVCFQHQECTTKGLHEHFCGSEPVKKRETTKKWPQSRSMLRMLLWPRPPCPWRPPPETCFGCFASTRATPSS